MGHFLWVVVQWVLAPRHGAMLRRMVRERMDLLGVGRWLDVGCGPRARVARTLPGTLIGIDSALGALRETRRDGVTCVCATAKALPFADQSFDGVVSFGLLHHLNDADLDTALVEMRRVARADGIVLLFDCVKPESALRRPLSALLRAFDRGRHIRDEGNLRRLLDRRGMQLGPRLTYSWVGLEGCWAVSARSAR
jgi:ubiquinone/menaquinone biosynthesis C-methylase UbiE